MLMDAWGCNQINIYKDREYRGTDLLIIKFEGVSKSACLSLFMLHTIVSSPIAGNEPILFKCPVLIVQV